MKAAGPHPDRVRSGVVDQLDTRVRTRVRVVVVVVVIVAMAATALRLGSRAAKRAMADGACMPTAIPDDGAPRQGLFRLCRAELAPLLLISPPTRG